MWKIQSIPWGTLKTAYWTEFYPIFSLSQGTWSRQFRKRTVIRSRQCFWKRVERSHNDMRRISVSRVGVMTVHTSSWGRCATPAPRNGGPYPRSENSADNFQALHFFSRNTVSVVCYDPFPKLAWSRTMRKRENGMKLSSKTRFWVYLTESTVSFKFVVKLQNFMAYAGINSVALE